MKWCLRSLVLNYSFLCLGTVLLGGVFVDDAYGSNVDQKNGDSINSTSTQISVSKIRIVGNTVLKVEQLKPILKPLEGRSVSAEELRKAANAITQLYIDRGYLTTRAFIPEQNFNKGIVNIIIQEGSIKEIKIEGTKRLTNYIRSRIELDAGKPLNLSKLEDRLRLLKADPLIKNIEANLKAAGEPGQSILTVRVTEANPFTGSFGVDNYSPPSVGADRLGLSLAYGNLTGIGDRISASYSPRIETIDGTYNLNFSYQAPLNAMDGTLELKTSIDRNKVVRGQFKDLDIRGESELYEITYRQPFIRTPREEFAISLGFAYQDGQTFTFQGATPFGFGPDRDGNSRTSVLKFGQEYTLRDVAGAWGLRSQFRVGFDLLDATKNLSPTPDSKFFSWLGQIQRLQVFNENNFLILQGDLQLTPDSLLSSEQFVVGGGQSVRGYRQNARSGDNGFRFSIEDRITLAKNDQGEAIFILAPFFDMGCIWSADNNPNPLPDQQFIAALGLGLLWQPIEKLNLRLDYAPPLVDLDDRGDNIQDDGLHFSAGYKF